MNVMMRVVSMDMNMIKQPRNVLANLDGMAINVNKVSKKQSHTGLIFATQIITTVLISK